MKRIQGEGWIGYREKVEKDTGRRLDRCREKVEKDTGRRLERIQGEG